MEFTEDLGQRSKEVARSIISDQAEVELPIKSLAILFAPKEMAFLKPKMDALKMDVAQCKKALNEMNAPFLEKFHHLLEDMGDLTRWEELFH